jgi:hypothetical protein
MSVVINGSAGVTTNSGAVYDGIQRGTALATTSGTAINFTNIPSWVKRITIMANNVSTNGGSYLVFRIGSGGAVATSGYTSIVAIQYGASAVTSTTSTVGFPIWIDNSGYTGSGQLVITNLSGNIWQAGGLFIQSTGTNLMIETAGFITLGGALNIVGIGTTNGTDVFDSGTINILYE